MERSLEFPTKDVPVQSVSVHKTSSYLDDKGHTQYSYRQHQCCLEPRPGAIDELVMLICCCFILEFILHTKFI